ncbi:hypothetical protein C8R46DRAFT_1063352 [Mycena filopes]|nr:hypothetical protein C8R46DRAFT_1063352 [Mycena filopes]
MLLVVPIAWWAALALAEQISFGTPQTTSQFDNSTAPFVFNSLSSLLTQCSRILHPFTLLYHARQDSELPPSPEWVAWDPEMSFAIMTPRGGQTHLITYRTTRPANIIYFDGMSAAWGPGWLDSQHMFLYGTSKNASKDLSWWDDYARAENLCDWAKSRNVEGFVRMNAGFEIVWCDFQSPTLHLVSHLNITPPGTPESNSIPRSPRRDLVDLVHSLDDPPERPPWRGPGGGDMPGRGPGRGGPGWRPRISDLAQTGTLEWVRAASHRSFTPQPHLTLSYADMVTYYHPRLTSLVADRVGRSMYSHRLVNISAQDAQSIVQEVDHVLARRAAGDHGSGFDWETTARSIVEYWGDRISHMHAYLVNASDPDANVTASLPAIRTLSYTLLNPYMQPGLTPNASGWDLFFGLPSAVLLSFGANITALERCTYQSTGFLATLRTTPQEALLQNSIESVLGRLCNEFGVIFAQSSDLVETGSDEHRAFIQQWTRNVEDLMKWLDWTVWLRCENVCPLDHVCSTPLWPIAWFQRPWGEDSSDAESLKPRCMRIAV